MKYTVALLPFILILLFTLASNIEKYSLMENMSSEVRNTADGIKECEVVYNNSGEIYRDGLVNSFDYFKNRSYPVECSEDTASFGPLSEPAGFNPITVY